MFKIEPIKEVKLPPIQPHDFNTFFCVECGEVTVERYARGKNDPIVCTPCAEKL